MALNKTERRQRIHYRIRKHVNGTAERPRMVVLKVLPLNAKARMGSMLLLSWEKLLRSARKRKASLPYLSTAEAISIMAELKVWQMPPVKVALFSKDYGKYERKKS